MKNSRMFHVKQLGREGLIMAVLNMPQKNEHAEKTLLMVFLMNPLLIGNVIGKLVPDDFYYDANRLIFAGMLKLRNRLDVFTLNAWLKENHHLEEVTPEYVLSLVDGLDTMVDALQIDSWADVANRVIEASVARKLADVCYQASLETIVPDGDVVQVAPQKPIKEVLQDTRNRINQLLSILENKVQP